jgi:hypothetical protein
LSWLNAQQVAQQRLMPKKACLVEPVMHEVAPFLGPHESSLTQHPQVLRHSPLRDPEPSRQRIHAQRRAAQEFNNPHAGWRRERLGEARNLLGLCLH